MRSLLLLSSFSRKYMTLSIMVALAVTISCRSAYSALQQVNNIILTTTTTTSTSSSNNPQQRQQRQQQQRTKRTTAVASSSATIAAAAVHIIDENNNNNNPHKNIINNSMPPLQSSTSATTAATATNTTTTATTTTTTERETLQQREPRTLHNNMDRYPIITSRCPSSSTTPVEQQPIQTTLVLQCSTDRAWLLKEHCRRWKHDPIVAVVVVTKNGTTTTSSSDDDLKANTAPFMDTDDCPQLTIIEYELQGSEAAPENYPINKLRNLGLDAVQTSHVLVADVDFIPSQNLDDTIRTSLRERRQQQPDEHDDEQEALVVPAFEKLPPRGGGGDDAAATENNNSNSTTSSSISLGVPNTFEQLRECVVKGKSNIVKDRDANKCDVFHRARYPDGHSTTKSDDWLEKKWYNDEEDEYDEDDIDPTNVTTSVVVGSASPSAGTAAAPKNATTTTTNNDNNLQQRQPRQRQPRQRQPRSIPCFDSSGYEPYSVIRWCPTTTRKAESSSGDSNAPTPMNNISSSNKDTTIANYTRPVGPYFDERFVGFGLNKIQHVSHLRYLGYKFRVLPGGGFLCHYPHSISKSRQMFSSNKRNLLTRMVKLYKQFNKDLDTMHNHTSNNNNNNGTAITPICAADTTATTAPQAKPKKTKKKAAAPTTTAKKE